MPGGPLMAAPPFAGAPPAELVAERLVAVRARVAGAGGDPSKVTVVAITKGFGPAAVEAALAAGLTHVGESYAAELEAKASAPYSSQPTWHFVGQVQRNKVGRIAGVVGLWESVDRLAAGREIARRAPSAAVLVEVNLSGQPSRGGCAPGEAPVLVRELREAGLDVRGLMGIGPLGPPEMSREGFAGLARLTRQLGLHECSMGMSDDLDVAVAEGATMVRLGRALFGERPTPGGNPLFSGLPFRLRPVFGHLGEK